MGSRFTTYEDAMEYLELEELSDRRESICLNFALKCLTNPKFKDLFTLVPENDHYIRERRKFLGPQCSKDRYRNSPLVYLTRLLNKHFEEDTNLQQ